MNFEELFFICEANIHRGRNRAAGEKKSHNKKENTKENKDDQGVKFSEKEARDIITPEWLLKRKKEISKLKESWESPIDTVAPGIVGSYLGKINKHDIYAVDADKVMIKYDMDFVVAGNHEKWPFIPKNQYWVDKTYRLMDAAHDLLHESIEETIMRECGFTYDDAHVFANKLEKEYIRDLLKHTNAVRRLAIGDIKIPSDFTGLTEG